MLKLSSFDCSSHKMISEIIKNKSKLIISTGGAFDRK